eukprot:scaffold17342_cov130-Isochrysis_galbana.AAC.4
MVMPPAPNANAGASGKCSRAHVRCGAAAARASCVMRTLSCAACAAIYIVARAQPQCPSRR